MTILVSFSDYCILYHIVFYYFWKRTISYVLRKFYNAISREHVTVDCYLRSYRIVLCESIRYSE